MNSPDKLNQPKTPKRPFKRVLTSGILVLLPFFLFVYIDISESNIDPLSFPSLNLQIGEPKLDLQESSSVSIQLNTKSIQASSLNEQIFPMLVSRKIPSFQSSYRKPIDLICVFTLKEALYYTYAMQIKDIKQSFRHLLPWLTEQDRLSVVLFGRSGHLVDRFQIPRSKISPLKNTTLKNKRNIISAIGDNILKGEMSMWSALEAAKMVLDQRPETNQTTAIFIMKDSDGLGPGYGIVEALNNAIKQVDQAKIDLSLQDKGFIIQPFFSSYKRFGEPFAEIFATLRGGVVETEFLVKPEESEILKGVKMSRYNGVMYDGWLWFQEDGAYFIKRPSLKPGSQEELFFDLKIPRITQSLSSSPIEVKVASCQLTFRLVDGSQVVKKADLMVKIFGEGEEFVAEEDSRKVMKDFYYKWGEDWLFTAVLITGHNEGWEEAGKLLERYRESLGGSIVKDDEELQNGVKRTEENVEIHRKYVDLD